MSGCLSVCMSTCCCYWPPRHPVVVVCSFTLLTWPTHRVHAAVTAGRRGGGPHGTEGLFGLGCWGVDRLDPLVRRESALECTRAHACTRAHVHCQAPSWLLWVWGCKVRTPPNHRDGLRVGCAFGLLQAAVHHADARTHTYASARGQALDTLAAIGRKASRHPLTFLSYPLMASSHRRRVPHCGLFMGSVSHDLQL